MSKQIDLEIKHFEDLTTEKREKAIEELSTILPKFKIKICQAEE